MENTQLQGSVWLVGFEGWAPNEYVLSGETKNLSLECSIIHLTSVKIVPQRLQ